MANSAQEKGERRNVEAVSILGKRGSTAGAVAPCEVGGREFEKKLEIVRGGTRYGDSLDETEVTTDEKGEISVNEASLAGTG